MSRSIPSPHLNAAIEHLRKKDRRMRKVIDRVGPCLMKRDPRHFTMLARSIVSQQISTIVARVLWSRLEELAGEEGITAASLAKLTTAKLRTIGISQQKSRYLLDLSAKVNDGLINFRSLNRRSDDEIIVGLTQVTGIGVWTAQMYLIFSLGRLDVFPWNDLGVRTQIQRIYDLPELPSKDLSHSIAAPWSPYASVASWYCWRHGDLKS